MQTNALRVAAYFLVAHYLIVTALVLLGKGTPDFLRFAITLGFLIGAVGALFSPRKLGWVMVVAYAWYVANPFVLGAWAVWISPELKSSAKITASIVLALINSPLIAALVLVFKPASFASFRSPPDNTATRAAKSAGIANSQAASRGRNAAVLAVVLVVAAIVAVYAYRPAPRSEWMTSAQYQRDFDTRAPKGYYPQEVEGRCEAGSEKYLPDWRPQPPGAGFFSYFGLTREGYDNKNREYVAQGFSLVSVKHFRDCSGVERYQATWLRR